jgi:hypothetical protein
MLSGVLMGLVYELSFDIPIHLPNFSQGTRMLCYVILSSFLPILSLFSVVALAEFLWGFFMTAALICNILGHYRGMVHSILIGMNSDDSFLFVSIIGSLSARHSNIMVSKDRQLINRTFTIIIVIICFIMFLISSITYSVVEQSDMRNKYQTLIGIYSSFCTFLIISFC